MVKILWRRWETSGRVGGDIALLYLEKPPVSALPDIAGIGHIRNVVADECQNTRYLSVCSMIHAGLQSTFLFRHAFRYRSARDANYGLIAEAKPYITRYPELMTGLKAYRARGSTTEKVQSLL